MSKHPLYNTWNGMKQRCYYKKHKDFKYYGGKGVKVCERWLKSFEHFASDMGVKPTTSHTLDRRDGDGDYSPVNCKWSTPKEQAANRKEIEYVKAHKLRKTSSTGYKYVTKHTNGFMVRLPDGNGGRVFLGLCETIGEAIIVRDNGVKQVKKERTNERNEKGRYRSKNN